jgi:hypothetical protein
VAVGVPPGTPKRGAEPAGTPGDQASADQLPTGVHSGHYELMSKLLANARAMDDEVAEIITTYHQHESAAAATATPGLQHLHQDSPGLQGLAGSPAAMTPLTVDDMAAMMQQHQQHQQQQQHQHLPPHGVPGAGGSVPSSGGLHMGSLGLGGFGGSSLAAQSSSSLGLGSFTSGSGIFGASSLHGGSFTAASAASPGGHLGGGGMLMQGSGSLHGPSMLGQPGLLPPVVQLPPQPPQLSMAGRAAAGVGSPLGAQLVPHHPGGGAPPRSMLSRQIDALGFGSLPLDAAGSPAQVGPARTCLPSARSAACLSVLLRAFVPACLLQPEQWLMDICALLPACLLQPEQWLMDLLGSNGDLASLPGLQPQHQPQQQQHHHQQRQHLSALGAASSHGLQLPSVIAPLIPPPAQASAPMSQSLQSSAQPSSATASAAAQVTSPFACASLAGGQVVGSCQLPRQQLPHPAPLPGPVGSSVLSLLNHTLQAGGQQGVPGQLSQAGMAAGHAPGTIFTGGS